jgi:fatty-acyl-CoA synthase
MFIPLTPLRFLNRAVDVFGKKTGVVSGSRQFTYREFAERCGRLAAALRGLGVATGDRVAYLSFNTHQLLEGYYGVIQAGAIVMPLNVRLAPQELVTILNHAEAVALLFENDFAPLIDQLKKLAPGIRQYINLDDPAYESMLAASRPERAEFMPIDENSPAELFYTSGSTGTPKGVVLSHRTLYLHALDIAWLTEAPETAVDLHTIPLFHANGWGRPQCSTMLGVKQVMVRRFDPVQVCALIQEHRATQMSLVPTMANALINCPDAAKFDLSSLRRVMIGGAASSPELIQRLEAVLRCQCFAGYGLTETAPVMTVAVEKGGIHYSSDAEKYRRKAMAGWPVPGVEVRVVDLHMKDVPRDMQAIGEVITRSDHVMEGYYKDQEGTKTVMTDGWLHTGDMAVWDDEGFIHIVDRKKEIIISGGENISSIEVEKAIFAHPDVFECAVVAAPDDKWGEVPAAVVVRKPGSSLTHDVLLAFLEDKLGKFKMPRIIEITEEPLPKTGTGKVRKLIIKEKFWAGHDRRVHGG